MIGNNYQLASLSLNDVQAVLEVGRLRSFRRAADSCKVSQPSLSAQVKKVEEALGVRLFERERRQFLVTDAGERALPLLQSISDAYRGLGESMSSRDEAPLCGSLSLGMIPTLGPYYAPHLLPLLRRSYPELKLFLHERFSAGLESDVAGGKLDAAILATPASNKSLGAMPLFYEPFLLVAPDGHPVLAADAIDPSSLRPNEMILLEEGHCLRGQALAACGGKLRSQPRLVAGSLEILRHLVAAGHGYSLMPALAAAGTGTSMPIVTYRHLEPAAPGRTLALIYRRGFQRMGDLATLAKLVREHLPIGVSPVPRHGMPIPSITAD